MPSGVLYGFDGASIEQCDDLLLELEFFKGLLSAAEQVQFRELVELASLHYPRYREYLLQNGRQGYRVFLAERPAV